MKTKKQIKSKLYELQHDLKAVEHAISSNSKFDYFDKNKFDEDVNHGLKIQMQIELLEWILNENEK